MDINKSQEDGSEENTPLQKDLGVMEKDPEFEDILNLIGPQGRYQKLLLYGILCPFIAASPFFVLNNIFLLDIPDHWCKVGQGNWTVNPELLELDYWKNLTIPREIGPDGNERFSQCSRYMIVGDTSSDIIPCSDGWEYDRTDYETTIPSEYDWVCDKVDYATQVFTVGGLGSAFGTIVFGGIADKIGRKPVFFLTCFVNFVFKTGSLFLAYNATAFKVLNFLAGAAFPVMFSMPALIVAEVCGADYRSWTYAATWMIWVVGNSLLPLVAWISRKWLTFGLISSLPALLVFVFYPFMDESPRWLLTRGRGVEARKIINKIARTNKVKFDASLLESKIAHILTKREKEKGKNGRLGFWTLFQHWRLAKNTTLLITAWSMNCLLYYGITLNTTQMAGNKFLNYFLLSIIELPSGYLAGVLVEKTGRRWTQAVFFLLCVISCGVCAVSFAEVFGESVRFFLVILGALGIKFGVTITSMVVYLQGAEIFPTQLRSTGNGLASTISSFLGIVGPYIVFTGKIDASLPYVLLGLLSALGLVSSVSLPETFGQSLPETVEDANKFGKGEKFWSYLPGKREDKEEKESGEKGKA